jgi:hypothetical protein
MTEYTFDKQQAMLLRSLVIEEIGKAKATEYDSDAEKTAWLTNLSLIHTELCKYMGSIRDKGASNG